MVTFGVFVFALMKDVGDGGPIPCMFIKGYSMHNYSFKKEWLVVCGWKFGDDVGVKKMAMEIRLMEQDKWHKKEVMGN
jgi:hypothetical protein